MSETVPPLRRPEKKIRPVAGIAIFNRRGELLLGSKRLRSADTRLWQAPQGGIEQDWRKGFYASDTSRKMKEGPCGAALREAREEMGLRRGDLEVRHVSGAPYLYDLPARVSVRKREDWGAYYMKQGVTWVVMQCLISDDVIRQRMKEEATEPEFDGFAWVKPDDVLEMVAENKRGAYQALLETVLAQPWILSFGGEQYG